MINILVSHCSELVSWFLPKGANATCKNNTSALLFGVGKERNPGMTLATTFFVVRLKKRRCLYCVVGMSLLAQYIWLRLDTLFRTRSVFPAESSSTLARLLFASRVTATRHSGVLAGYGSAALTQAISYDSLTAISFSSSASLPSPPPPWRYQNHHPVCQQVKEQNVDCWHYILYTTQRSSVLKI